MACESGNFTIADLDRKADYGPLNGLSTDLVKLNSIGERRGKTRQARKLSELAPQRSSTEFDVIQKLACEF